MILNTLNPEDIDEKIYLNKEAGINIEQLQALIKKELKDFQWMQIRAQVQCQLYVEQLEHIARRIEQLKSLGMENPYKHPDYKKRLEPLNEG